MAEHSRPLFTGVGVFNENYFNSKIKGLEAFMSSTKKTHSQVETETSKDSHLCSSCIHSGLLISSECDQSYCFTENTFFSGVRIYCRSYKVPNRTIYDLSENDFIKSHFVLCSVKGGGQ